MKKAFVFGLLSVSLLFASAVFAQNENPCIMEDNNWTLHVICNVCGDGVIDDAEECDDGNTISGDGCSSSCVHEEQSILLETGPESDSSTSTSAGPNQVLPTQLLGVGPDDQATLAFQPQTPMLPKIVIPEHIQFSGAPTIASLIAARNIKQAQLAKQASLGTTSIILPNRLAQTGGTENIAALIMILFGVVGIRGSLRFVK